MGIGKFNRWISLKIDQLDLQSVKSLLEKTKSELSLLFKNLENNSLVIFNKMSSMLFSGESFGSSNLENFAEQINQYVIKELPSNFQLMNLEKYFQKISISRSFNQRFFYSSKAFYTIDFFKTYSEKSYTFGKSGDR